MSRLSKGDPCSFSEPENVVTRHVDLFWNIDFATEVVSGEVLLHFEVVATEIDRISLDVSELTIQQVSIKNANEKIPVNFSVSEHVKGIGAKLTGGSLIVSIVYETSPTTSGLLWLKPEQTRSKIHPYMYSQGQAIHARSFLPCQDTGAVKFTFRAEVNHPVELTALLSGVRLSGEHGKTVYEQKVPIPAYLVAIAVGPLVSRRIGPISNVWCEEELIDACAEEFSETSRMLSIAEDVCGPYEWKVYDILVMPKNFPSGGMENPCLTFLSPTTLTGDKSLANTVVHEISHSWAGNLVTNKNYDHFWVNEGFARFLQGKKISRLRGTPLNEFLAIRHLTELQDCLDGQLKNNPVLTKLVVDLTGINPDDAFSEVPYVKGENFLRYLEDLFGGPAVFEPFIHFYIQKYKNKSVDSDDVKATVIEFFTGKADDKLGQIDWNLWLYGEGGIPIVPKYDTSLKVAVDQQVEIWTNHSIENIKRHPDLQPNGLHAFQLFEILAMLMLKPNLHVTEEWIKLLEQTYGFVGTKNSEYLFYLCRLYIKGRLLNRLDQVLAFANSNFYLRYIRPIYRELNGWPEAKPTAIANFLSVKNQMMRSVRLDIYKELELEPEVNLKLIC